MDKELFSSKEAARYLGMSVAFLERDRWAGARIAFVKIGRSVRYRRTELDQYIQSHTRRSTSDVGA